MGSFLEMGECHKKAVFFENESFKCASGLGVGDGVCVLGRVLQ